MIRLFGSLSWLAHIVLLTLFWRGQLFAADTDPVSASGSVATGREDITAITYGSRAAVPELIFPWSQRQADSIANIAAARSASLFTESAAPGVRRVTESAATVVSPPIHAVITDCPVAYEIEPNRPVDSVKLFVKHSHMLADTSGVIASPPYKVVWDCANAPDQDQMHLQFGYILYSGDTLAVTSPPAPHQWMLDRKRGIRNRQTAGKNYHVRQMTYLTFEINGDPSKWSDIRGADIGEIGHFKMMWTGGKLFFIAEIRDSSITTEDFVELHVDMHRDRADFAGINHRTLRFYPLGGSLSFTAELTSGGFTLADSVNALVREELEWKADIDGDVYVIEASIPFMALSDIAIPAAKFGIDVSVTNTDKAGGETVTSYYSWAGTERYFRYSPSGWGSAKVSQAGNALRYIMMGLIFISCAAVVFIAFQSIFTESRKKKSDGIDDGGYSPVTNAVIEQIEEKLTNAKFGIGDVSKSVGEPESEIRAALRKDMDVEFEQLLTVRRIKRSQKLMREPELTVEKIAEMCGFATANAYRTSFKAQMRVDPEVSRQAMLDKIREEEQERLEDEEDD